MKGLDRIILCEDPRHQAFATGALRAGAGWGEPAELLRRGFRDPWGALGTVQTGLFKAEGPARRYARLVPCEGWGRQLGTLSEILREARAGVRLVDRVVVVGDGGQGLHPSERAAGIWAPPAERRRRLHEAVLELIRGGGHDVEAGTPGAWVLGGRGIRVEVLVVDGQDQDPGLAPGLGQLVAEALRGLDRPESRGLARILGAGPSESAARGRKPESLDVPSLVAGLSGEGDPTSWLRAAWREPELKAAFTQGLRACGAWETLVSG